MQDWEGYERASRALLSVQRFQQALAKVHEGLEKFPLQPELLTTAIYTYQAMGHHERSLEWSQKLISCHPDLWIGHGLAARDLIALKRFADAKSILLEALGKFPDQPELATLHDYNRAFTLEPIEKMSEAEKARCSLTPEEIIAYSKDDAFFPTIQSKRSAIDPCTSFDKKLLFVAGLGRSGTTALSEMLSLSSALELYTEFYIPFRIDGYSAADFDTATIAQRLGASDHTINHNIFARNPTSTVIGDKRPYYQFSAESTFDNFRPGQVRVLYVHRPLHDICRSTHIRSENPSDYSWNLECGVEHTILTYNASCRQFIHLYNHRRDVFNTITFVDYTPTFSDFELARSIFERHELPLDSQEELELHAFIEKSAAIAKRRRNYDALDYHIKRSMLTYLDVDAHRRFLEIGGLSESE
jgi:tetratricopeptide (TPR) repeat protein